MKSLAVCLMCLVCSVVAVKPSLAGTAQELIDKYQATDLTADPRAGFAFWNNPFPYQDQLIYVVGGYHQNVAADKAILAILPGIPSTTYIVMLETTRDFSRKITVGCVAKVLGKTRIRQGLLEREIPHMQAVECLP